MKIVERYIILREKMPEIAPALEKALIQSSVPDVLFTLSEILKDSEIQVDKEISKVLKNLADLHDERS